MVDVEIRPRWIGTTQQSLLRHSGNTTYAAQAKSHAHMLAASETAKMRSSPDVVARALCAPGAARTILFLRWILSDRALDAVMRMVETGLG